MLCIPSEGESQSQHRTRKDGNGRGDGNERKVADPTREPREREHTHQRGLILGIVCWERKKMRGWDGRSLAGVLGWDRQSWFLFNLAVRGRVPGPCLAAGCWRGRTLHPFVIRSLESTAKARKFPCTHSRKLIALGPLHAQSHCCTGRRRSRFTVEFRPSARCPVPRFPIRESIPIPLLRSALVAGNLTNYGHVMTRSPASHPHKRRTRTAAVQTRAACFRAHSFYETATKGCTTHLLLIDLLLK